MKKEPSQNIGEKLPQINVKPLDIVEPQLLGKSSLVGKTSNPNSGLKEVTPNDFEPSHLKKNHSEKKLPDFDSNNEPQSKSLEGNKRPVKAKSEELNLPSMAPIKWKTIFNSKKFDLSIFYDNVRSVNAPWLLKQPTPSQTPNPPQPKQPEPEKPKYDSNVSTGHSNVESTQSSNEGNSGISQKPSPQKVTTQNVQTNAQPQPVKKEPITIESIFKKYRQQNKTVTKIVHKKNNGRTEKWVYFSDGTSVLEDPGEPPQTMERPVGSNPPMTQNNFQYSGQNPQWNGQQGMNQTGTNQIQPSNVFFYDHSNLVAEFDPENPNNIAMTLYEITTLQQKHIYCKYFEPAPDRKFLELASIVDKTSVGNPSVYHNLDQLNDEHLLQPKKIEDDEPAEKPYWIKSLRKSNKRLISKKKNNVISKKNVPQVIN